MLKLQYHDRSSPVFLEGEGRQIGSLSLPKILWDAMQRSPTLVLESDMTQRVEIGIRDYVVDLLSRIEQRYPGERGFELFAERHRKSLYNIRKRLGEQQYRLALDLLEEAISAHRNNQTTEGYRPFIRLLLEKYYDPMYDYQLSQRTSKVLFRGDHAELIDWLRKRGEELVS
jgi:tRNA 2-selenouridine synthase